MALCGANVVATSHSHHIVITDRRKSNGLRNSYRYDSSGTVALLVCPLWLLLQLRVNIFTPVRKPSLLSFVIMWDEMLTSPTVSPTSLVVSYYFYFSRKAWDTIFCVLIYIVKCIEMYCILYLFRIW